MAAITTGPTDARQMRLAPCNLASMELDTATAHDEIGRSGSAGFPFLENVSTSSVPAPTDLETLTPRRQAQHLTSKKRARLINIKAATKSAVVKNKKRQHRGEHQTPSLRGNCQKVTCIRIGASLQCYDVIRLNGRQLSSPYPQWYLVFSSDCPSHSCTKN